MYRSTHPFRSSVPRTTRSARTPGPRRAFALDLAAWHGHLAPANRPPLAPAQDGPVAAMTPVGARPLPLATPARAAA